MQHSTCGGSNRPIGIWSAGNTGEEEEEEEEEEVVHIDDPGELMEGEEEDEDEEEEVVFTNSLTISYNACFQHSPPLCCPTCAFAPQLNYNTSIHFVLNNGSRA